MALVVEGGSTDQRCLCRLPTLLARFIRCDVLEPEDARQRLNRKQASGRGYHHVFLDQVPFDCARELVGGACGLWPRPRLVVLDPLLSVAQIAELSFWGVIALRQPLEEADARALLDVLDQSTAAARRVRSFARSRGLTRRETELLLAALDGLNDKEIAGLLRCREGTLKTHWQRIRGKCNVHSQRDVFASILRSSP